MRHDAVATSWQKSNENVTQHRDDTVTVTIRYISLDRQVEARAPGRIAALLACKTSVRATGQVFKS
eukprot:1138171-Pelagomonas_calceolata.AAC.7